MVPLPVHTRPKASTGTPATQLAAGPVEPTASLPALS
jgi:hypothetical protein